MSDANKSKKEASSKTPERPAFLGAMPAATRPSITSLSNLSTFNFDFLNAAAYLAFSPNSPATFQNVSVPE